MRIDSIELRIYLSDCHIYKDSAALIIFEFNRKNKEKKFKN
jgi:hypothetical protein